MYGDSILKNSVSNKRFSSDIGQRIQLYGVVSRKPAVGEAMELRGRKPGESLRGPIEEAATKVNQRRKQLIKVCSRHIIENFPVVQKLFPSLQILFPNNLHTTLHCRVEVIRK